MYMLQRDNDLKYETYKIKIHYPLESDSSILLCGTLLLIIVLIVFAHTTKFCQFLLAGKTKHEHNI